MPMAPTKKPAAPGSIAPVGPNNPAATIYPTLSGKTPVNGGGDKSDAWRGGPIKTPNGKVQTKGAVQAKDPGQAPGNQGSKNSHTRPAAIKSNGSARQVERAANGGVGSTAALKTPSSKVYPHLTRR